MKQTKSNYCIYFQGKYLSYTDVALRLLELQRIKNQLDEMLSTDKSKTKETNME